VKGDLGEIMINTDRIQYYADGVLLDAGYDDMTTYHGGRFPAGTVLAYKALLLVRELMFPNGEDFVRGKFSIETAFLGTGFLDAIEMPLRCNSLGLYKIDPEMIVPVGTVPAPVKGKFFFRFIQGNGIVELTVKPGLVPQDFYKATEDLHNGKITSEDEVLKVRRNVEMILLNINPHEIFDVHVQKPYTDALEKGSEAPLLQDDSYLKVADYGEFSLNAERLRRYHGDNSICGMCLTWALVRQWARNLGFSNKPIPRRQVTLISGASGRGINDALEFLFRISGENRYTVDTRFGDGHRAPEVLPGAGSFIFGLSLGNAAQDIFILKDELAPRDYLRLCKLKSEKPHNFKQMAELKSLQREFARRMLSEAEPFRVL
jgi:hypothetical protein